MTVPQHWAKLVRLIALASEREEVSTALRTGTFPEQVEALRLAGLELDDLALIYTDLGRIVNIPPEPVVWVLWPWRDYDQVLGDLDSGPTG